MFGWGENDRTTKDERAAWKKRAQEQMDDQNGRSSEQTEATPDDQPKRHARRKGLFD